MTAFPKPPRYEDPAAIAEYMRTHPRCELLTCGRYVAGEPHHLRGRKVGRDDRPGNLLRLCVPHHMEWHTAGRRTWFARHGQELEAEARQKVGRVLEPGGGK